MSASAQKKLREACFFLAHLDEQGFTASPGPAEAAEFYLSAFLSAARSVTLVLKAEHPTTYQQWSDTWRSTIPPEDRQLLSKFTQARNRAVKRESPVVHEDHMSSLARNLHSPLQPKLLFFFEDLEPQPVERVLTGRLTPEHTVEEVIPTCKRYITVLSRLLAAFVDAHK